ncbi:hypothetical protein DSM104443_00857 [Usitatibacter rugosus]|uniref:TonB C-terminal domain-containing protein n=1 Tax=Usitatibacter rugosus TaxID=2732067 RepID=A0A6M4GVZ2_9PROT|nr:hypothetical protein [Usitatibacter rugosus]QJR09807.1 hypothetical protein DSM104443_00857 [Usitatibacter rugosus]
MRETAGFALALLMLSGFACAQELTGWGAELASRPAHPIRVVPPDYPAQALAQGTKAAVDVTGKVTAGGSMQDATFRSSTDDPAFQKAIEDVLPYWIFSAEVDTRICEPVASEATVRVWFEIVDGKPKVSVSQPVSGKPYELKRESGRKFRVEPVRRIRVKFPREGIRKDIGSATVIALSRVGADGTVQSIVFQNTRVDDSFYAEAKAALRRWTYDIEPGALEDRPFLCLEHSLAFKLLD